MKPCFLPADILLPQNSEYSKWSVIACDQFTSDREYWNRVCEYVGNCPSTFDMVFPEIDLNNEPEKRIEKISEAMRSNLENGVFASYPSCYVYVERTLLDGSIRPGIVGMIDLEQYHYDPSFRPAIGATEQTVLERVPPRIAVRRKAEIEFSHVILFCNDSENLIFRSLSEKKDTLPILYAFDFMEGGGHVVGRHICGDDAKSLDRAIEEYTKKSNGTSFLVADGNHSLVTAKCWYEELKKNNPGVDFSCHPARYAMVELENILDDSIAFEPIHRVIFDTDTEKLIQDLQKICTPNGCEIPWETVDACGSFSISVPDGELPVSVLQAFLDDWLKKNPGRIDYIHDKESVKKLAKQKNAIGLLLPTFDKSELFAFGASGKLLPRKTFSLGHGREKRYYLEGRKIR